MLPQSLQGAASRQEPDFFFRLRQPAPEVTANRSRSYHCKSHGFFPANACSPDKAAACRRRYCYQSKPFTVAAANPLCASILLPTEGSRGSYCLLKPCLLADS